MVCSFLLFNASESPLFHVRIFCLCASLVLENYFMSLSMSKLEKNDILYFTNADIWMKVMWLMTLTVKAEQSIQLGQKLHVHNIDGIFVLCFG